MFVFPNETKETIYSGRGEFRCKQCFSALSRGNYLYKKNGYEFRCYTCKRTYFIPFVNTGGINETNPDRKEH